MEAFQVTFASSNLTQQAIPGVHHILSGSFRSLSLFLLAFSPLHRNISLVQEVSAFGPHQYLTTNPRKDRVYTTSWALPPTLSSWAVERPENGPWRVEHINRVPITAVSSYINTPAPFTHAYSTGGPTGETHLIDKATGGFGEKLQQFLFVPEDELEKADKTRAALRYGSHGVEFSAATGNAFIPVLGTDSIEMYARDPRSGLINHISSIPSPRGADIHDGPRHVKVHPNGKILYCVTEHTSLLDAYAITSDSLEYLSTRSLLPSTSDPSRYRGDTLFLEPPTAAHPSPRAIFATTRGADSSVKGWLSIFPLQEDGTFADGYEERWETPTSGGKANALDLLPKFERDASGNDEGLWILLTDDDDLTAGIEGGGIKVLEWDGWGKGVDVVAAWPRREDNENDGVRMEGGSHAIWLN